MRLVKFLGILLLAALSALSSYAQPGITVTASLVDGQGNIQKTAYLHWELWNCGNNVPQIIGQSNAVVAQQFDMRPNPTTGLISGSVYGNNQISCGGVTSTEWFVTEYKATNQAVANPQYYCLTAPGTFDPSVNQPCTVTPPPVYPNGLVPIWSNPYPALNQTWTQQAGTTANLYGSFYLNGVPLGAGPSGVTGNGSTNQVSVWNGISSLTGFSGFTFSSNTLTVPGLTGNGAINFSGATSLLVPNLALPVSAPAGWLGYSSTTSALIFGTGTSPAVGVIPWFSDTGVLGDCLTWKNPNIYQIGQTTCGASGGGASTAFENCTSDQSGNSFPAVTSLTNWFDAHWEFIYNTTTYINCTVYVPTAQTGATIAVDVYSADNTSGHTANIQTCDVQIPASSGNFQVGSLVCASPQTFTTTSTSYARSTLTFNVQSTLANGGILVVKIGTSPTGTAPTSDILVYPHFIL